MEMYLKSNANRLNKELKTRVFGVGVPLESNKRISQDIRNTEPGYFQLANYHFVTCLRSVLYFLKNLCN